MRIFTGSKMSNFNGNDIKHQDGSTATFRSIVCECLSVPTEADRGKDSMYFHKLYRLGQKIEANDFIELSIEELALIKDRITNSSYLTTIKGRIYDILEGVPVSDSPEY